MVDNPASGNGRSLDLPSSDIFDIEAGRIARPHVCYDDVDFAQQLALLPQRAQA